MTDLFLTVVQMSITSSVIILAVLLIRFFLKKAPRKYSYILWATAAFRLLCPVSFESAFSLFSLPVRSEMTADITLKDIPSIDIAESILEQKLSYLPNMDSSVEAFPTDHTYQWLAFQDKFITVGSVIWVVGIAAILLYSILSYLMLRRQLRTAIRLEARVWQSDNVRSPFILGPIRPRIYIPFGLTDESLNYVLTHERYHLRRLDHIIKFAAYLILVLHWFNPLVWLAFSMMSRDMEMSCDEKVLLKLNQSGQPSGTNLVNTDYSTTLLSFASNQRFPSASPLAFGETDVKRRIKHVLNWKKARPWMAAAAVLICLTGALVCSANPIPDGMVWAQNLNAEDIEKIELVKIPDMENLGYRIFSEEDFQKAVDLINASHGKHLLNPDIYYGGSSLFYITMKDGTEHKIGNAAGPGLYIDGEFYAADEDWMQNWDTLEITQSNSPFPEGFFQTEDSPYQSQKWAKALTENDAANIELQIWEGQKLISQRTLTENETAAAIELVNGSRGKRLTSPDKPYGDWKIVLSITTADGSCHTAANCNNEYLIIDGDYYATSISWLQSWDGICSAGELPEGFSQ